MICAEIIWDVRLTGRFWGYGRKPDYLQQIQTGVEKTYKLHTAWPELRFEH